MTSATATLLDASSEPPRSVWRARLVEFLVVGGATLVLLPLAWLYRQSAGLASSEYTISFVAFYAAFVINDPHFAVTYLLFYKDVKRRALGDVFGRAQRVRYWVAGFIVPLVLGVWAMGALTTASAHGLGLMIQLMFFLVGWHYVKQGFGVLTVLSARRGVRYSSFERNAVLIHCFAGWAHAWASPADPGNRFMEKGIVYTSIPHPPGLELFTKIVFLLSAVLVVFAFGRKWRREGRLPPLAPLTGLFVSVWLWSVYSSLDPLMVYLIPGLHSIQYLYFVWLLGRNEARAHQGPPDFKGTVRVRLGILAASALGLGWLLFHGAPEFLDGVVLGSSGDSEPIAGLGPTPLFAALFTIVNIHHYFMDHVIWRRENPETRYLRD